MDSKKKRMTNTGTDAKISETRKLNTKLRLMQLSFFMALAGFMNYLTLYLSSIGLSEMKIGVFYAIGSGGIVIQQYLFGKLLDKTGRFRLTSSLVMLISGIAVALMPGLKKLLPLELLLILLVYSFMKRYGNVFDVWVYGLKHYYPEIEYGSTRALGSFGEGLMGLILGTLISYGGFTMMFAVTSALLILTFLATVSVPDPKRRQEARKVVKKLKIRGPLFWYFSSFLVLKTASAVVSIFAPLLLERIGGGPDMYGRIIFLCAIVEVLVFTYWPRVMKRIGQRFSYIASIIFSLLCCLMLSLASSYTVFIIGRVLLSTSFVTYTISHLEYIDLTVDEETKGQAILTLSAISSGLGYMVSSFLGGAIMEYGTPLLMAIITGGINVVAFLLHFGAFKKAPEESDAL